MIKPVISSKVTPVIKKIIPNSSTITPKPVSKKISEEDIVIFKQYIFSKKFELKTTEEEIKQLFKLDDEEFFNASFEFLFKKLGIPECLKPNIIELPMDKNVTMAYDFGYNLLCKNPNAPKMNKLETYSFIRHELQHMIQNFEIYRHKTLGEEAILYYTETLTNNIISVTDNNARNIPFEQLKSMGFEKNILEIYKKLKVHLKNNDEKQYLKLLENLKIDLINNFLTMYQDFKNMIISEMGILKAGSKAEKRAEKFYDNMKASQFDINNKDINIGQYILDIRENEAIIAQGVALLDVNKHLKNEKICYIKYIKETIDNLISQKDKNKKQIEQVLETTKEVQEKNNLKSTTDLANYLFD